MLPVLIKYIVNKYLKKIDGYAGHVPKISFSRFGKKLRLKGFFLDKKDPDTGVHTRFFSAQDMELIIDGPALLKGSLMASLFCDSLSLVYFKEAGEAKKSAVKKPGKNSASALSSLQSPVVITQVEIANSKVEYIDSTISPVVDVLVTDLFIKGTDISNKEQPENELPAEITIKGNLGGGTLSAGIHADLSVAEPKFDLNAEIKNMDLTQLNSFFKAYGNFDVNKGQFSLFAEVAAKFNRFKGYVKPEIFNLDVVGPEDKNKTVLNKIWQTLLGGAAEILENQRKDELATKIPFSGNFTSPHPNLAYAVMEVLVNAFIHALTPSIDYEINIHSLDKP